MPNKSATALLLDNLLNLKSAKAKSAKFSKEQTKQLAKKAALKRWGKK